MIINQTFLPLISKPLDFARLGEASMIFLFNA